MLFSPNQVEVKRGEQVKFVLKNAGKVDHEFMLDSVANNAKHKIAMEENPDMEHDDPNGKRPRPTARARSSGASPRPALSSSPAHPGHYEAGMKGTVLVK